MTNLDHLPEDDDAKVLRGLAGDGHDLSKPMQIDFMVHVPDEDTAQALVEPVEQAGYLTDIWLDDETQEYTLTCAKTMLAEYQAILDSQAELDQIAQQRGGKIDGWGTFGNAEK